VVQVADISRRATCYGQASPSYTQTQRDYRSTFQKIFDTQPLLHFDLDLEPIS